MIAYDWHENYLTAKIIEMAFMGMIWSSYVF